MISHTLYCNPPPSKYSQIGHIENFSPPVIFSFPGLIRTKELLDHETTPHYWLTVYAMDRGVVPLSAFVEIYIEVQDVNDNAPQTSEPVYYPSVMENSPKDVSIIQIEAIDPDAKASDKLTYKITSGNPQGFFTINSKTGKMAFTLTHVKMYCALMVLKKGESCCHRLTLRSKTWANLERGC